MVFKSLFNFDFFCSYILSVKKDERVIFVGYDFISYGKEGFGIFGIWMFRVFWCFFILVNFYGGR